MIKFEGRIVQFGFGAVGKSFFEKLPLELKFNENNYYIITRDEVEFPAYINLGGIAANFIVKDVTRENFKNIFSEYLREGDMLFDFADTVGTRDICQWCAEENIMYINTGEADWSDNWYSIFEENEKKWALKKYYENNQDKNKFPIVLHHGNNPGLVSHFVKAALEYIVTTQFKKDKELRQLLKEKRFNQLAQSLGLCQIHVNDIDLQKIKGDFDPQLMINTWCMDSFWFELLSEATLDIGTKENIDFEDECKFYNREKGYLEFKSLGADKICNTYYTGGAFRGHLVPHEETISIAKNLQVEENGRVVYRPTVAFIYSPCEYAGEFLMSSKVNDYPNPDPEKPMDCEESEGMSIIRGYVYPETSKVASREMIASGTEYVGVLLLGEKFKPVWVGNRVELSYLQKEKNTKKWQTPTITPVAMSALAAVCWMIKNKHKGGIYFPDEISDYGEIIKTAEKYISKTIYTTFSREEVERGIGVDFNNLQIKDVLTTTTTVASEASATTGISTAGR